MELTNEQVAELRAVATSRDVSGAVATRARIVLWTARAGCVRTSVSSPGCRCPLWTVGSTGTPSLVWPVWRSTSVARRASRYRPVIRARILALTRTTPPSETGLSHWSSREMAAYITRTEGVSVSWHYVAKLWRDNDLKPHRQGTFKISRDPRFADKVFDVVGLYLDPPAGAVVLSFDEKTQVQALDRTQPLLPIDFGVTEKRTHDYKRHGTTNLFAALDVTTGTVVADCYPQRTGAEFLAFLRKAVKPHAGKEIHVVLDNLSTHDTPEVQAWLEANPNVTFHFTPVGSSWMNQIEIWFGIITRQAIRRGTFVSVNHLIQRIRAYVEHWNATAEPFVWTATADGHPRQGPPRPDQRQEARPEQLEVMQTGSRDTSSP